MKTDNDLSQYGLIKEGESAHCSRTMMLAELSALLSAEPDELAPRSRYQGCVEHDNCLAKRSGSTRQLTFGHLTRLYGLDPNIPIFHTLRYFWGKDQASHPLLALLCAYARDPLLQYSAPFIVGHKRGEEISSQAIANFLEKTYGERFSQATIRSAGRNIRSTFTQSGHLRGHSQKIRSRVNATPASVAYALYLGHLEGLSGKALFQTGYRELLDCTLEEACELSQMAAQKGWLILKRIDDIIEVVFPKWR